LTASPRGVVFEKTLLGEIVSLFGPIDSILIIDGLPWTNAHGREAKTSKARVAAMFGEFRRNPIRKGAEDRRQLRVARVEHISSATPYHTPENHASVPVFSAFSPNSTMEAGAARPFLVGHSRCIIVRAVSEQELRREYHIVAEPLPKEDPNRPLARCAELRKGGDCR
jgi:hypothetical protein